MEILPVAFVPFDEVDLPVARPFLHRLLALDRCVDVVMDLVPDQAMDAVLSRQCATDTVAVFADASQEIIGDADVERAVMRASKHVDKIGVFRCHGRTSCLGGRRCRTMGPGDKRRDDTDGCGATAGGQRRQLFASGSLASTCC